ncbi:MAG: SpoIVB peptidase S55 domain-containing protein [Wujia sp.]
MKRYRIFLCMLLLLVLTAIYFTSSNTQSNTNPVDSLPVTAQNQEGIKMVHPSGEPIGIYVKTKGVLVIATGQVEGPDGTVSSPCKNILQAGDYIMKIGDETISDKQTFIKRITGTNGAPVHLTIYRDGAQRRVSVTPVLNKQRVYVLGLWVKDDLSGIGTLTYTDGKEFAALGHSINDNDTGMQFMISDGAIYDAQIFRIQKPLSTSPGRLEGMINYTGGYVLGRVQANNSYGIHGILTKKTLSQINDEDMVPIGSKESVHTGCAQLYSAISGTPCKYEINIVSIQEHNETGRCMEFVVTDKALLDLTGGIVQGMSGTPILQDGKLIGAVTHVFVDNASKGYGIFIEEMMDEN